MSDFNDICVYFTDDYEVCNFADNRVAWMVNFGIGGIFVEIWRLDSPYSTPWLVDCATLSERVVSVEQLRDLVREHDEAMD